MASLVRDTAFSVFSAHGPPAGTGSRNGLSFQKSLKPSYPLYLTLGRYLVEAYHRRSLGNRPAREDDPPTKVEWSQFTATTYYYLCYNSPSQTMVHLQKMVSVVGFRNGSERKRLEATFHTTLCSYIHDHKHTHTHTQHETTPPSQPTNGVPVRHAPVPIPGQN